MSYYEDILKKTSGELPGLPVPAPRPSGMPWEGYYISAYGIAVKYGYEGSEEEWNSEVNAARLECRKNRDEAGAGAERAAAMAEKAEASCLRADGILKEIRELNWYGTIEEYNALPAIYPDINYFILEGEAPV